jgi:hypothetical protein
VARAGRNGTVWKGGERKDGGGMGMSEDEDGEGEGRGGESADEHRVKEDGTYTSSTRMDAATSGFVGGGLYIPGSRGPRRRLYPWCRAADASDSCTAQPTFLRRKPPITSELDA